MKYEPLPNKLTAETRLNSLDEAQIRGIYVDLSRETGVYGGPNTAFKAILLFLEYNGYEVIKDDKKSR